MHLLMIHLPSPRHRPPRRRLRLSLYLRLSRGSPRLASLRPAAGAMSFRQIRTGDPRRALCGPSSSTQGRLSKRPGSCANTTTPLAAVPTGAAPRPATLVLWSIPCFVGCTGATPTRLGAAMVAWLRWGQLETWSGNGTATASITPSRLAFPSSQTEFATSDAMCVVGVATLAGRSARVGARWCARVVMPRAARMCPYAHLGGMQGQACAGVTCTRPSDGCGTHGQRIRGMSSGVSRRCSHAKCENLKPLNPVVQLVNDVTGCSKVFPHA